jgi:hypothetical protein
LDDGFKSLGVYFGKLEPLNWTTLLSKFKDKIAFYKKKGVAVSLFSRSKILNTFLLPVLWYALKTLDPPDEFYTDIEKEILGFLWENRKHWVSKSNVFAPVSMGGLGVRHPKAQASVFRMRAASKIMNESNEYFLGKTKWNISSVLLRNEPLTTFYENFRNSVHKIKFTFNSLPADIIGEISLRNPLMFGDFPFNTLSKMKKVTVSEVTEYKGGQSHRMHLRAPEMRRLERELLHFDQRLKGFCDSLTESQDYSFCGYNFVSDLKEPLSNVNDYIFGFSCIYNVESFRPPDLLKFRSKKWSRLKGTKMSNPELDVVWRLWHDALLTFKVAKIL